MTVHGHATTAFCDPCFRLMLVTSSDDRSLDQGSLEELRPYAYPDCSGLAVRQMASVIAEHLAWLRVVTATVVRRRVTAAGRKSFHPYHLHKAFESSCLASGTCKDSEGGDRQIAEPSREEA